MKPRRLLPILPSLIATTLLVLGLAGPTTAATATTATATTATATAAQKLAVLSAWTQPTASSSAAWNAARLDRGRWAAYGFDWATDYCTLSPDEPLGFDFHLPCWRHDFGYRNYTLAAQYNANKSHVDSAFYYDMRVRCMAYSVVVRPACYSVAWIYYRAVVVFGKLTVSAADLQPAAQMKAAALAATPRAV